MRGEGKAPFHIKLSANPDRRNPRPFPIERARITIRSFVSPAGSGFASSRRVNRSILRNLRTRNSVSIHKKIYHAYICACIYTHLQIITCIIHIYVYVYCSYVHDRSRDRFESADIDLLIARDGEQQVKGQSSRE